MVDRYPGKTDHKPVIGGPIAAQGRQTGRPRSRACRLGVTLVAVLLQYRRSRVSSAVEQRFCKPKVGGSIPSPGTKEIKGLASAGLFFMSHCVATCSPLIPTIFSRCQSLLATRLRHDIALKDQWRSPPYPPPHPHSRLAHPIASFTGTTRPCHHRHRGDAAGDFLFPRSELAVPPL